MLSDLMAEQQRKLVQQIQENPHKVKPEVVSALALLDILDILQELRNPYSSN